MDLSHGVDRTRVCIKNLEAVDIDVLLGSVTFPFASEFELELVVLMLNSTAFDGRNSPAVQKRNHVTTL